MTIPAYDAEDITIRFTCPELLRTVGLLVTGSLSSPRPMDDTGSSTTDTLCLYSIEPLGLSALMNMVLSTKPSSTFDC